MFERFSDQARRVVVFAQEDARALGHGHIGTEHLVLGLARVDAGVVVDVFRFFELTHDAIQARVEELVPGSVAPAGHIPFTARAKKALERSLREALELGDEQIASEHLLLGVLGEGTGTAVQVLEALGADPAAVREKLLELRVERGDEARPAAAAPAGAPRFQGLEQVAVLQSSPVPPMSPTPRCSLCGRDEARCERMLLAGGMRICSECAHDAVAQLEAVPDDGPTLVRYRRRARGPADQERAVRAIEEAFDAALGPLARPVDEALPFVEGGPACRELLETLRDAGRRAPMVVNDQTIERVRFLDDDEAEVSVGIWLAGTPQPMIQPGHAILEDGTWKVRRSTLEHLARMAGPFLRRPPFGA